MHPPQYSGIERTVDVPGPSAGSHACASERRPILQKRKKGRPETRAGTVRDSQSRLGSLRGTGGPVSLAISAQVLAGRGSQQG